MRRWPLIMLAAALLDQALKAAALAWAEPGGLITIAHNTGITFGLLPGSNSLMIGVSLIAIAVLSVIAHKAEGLESVLFAITLGGITGNLLDRVVRGAVIDYLSIGSFPVFNLADVLIVSGVAGLILLEVYQNSSNSSRSSR